MLLATINASILLIALGALFSDALSTAFTFSFIACLVAAWASWLRGGRYHYREDPEPEASRLRRPMARARRSAPRVPGR